MKRIVVIMLALICASTAATGWAYNVSFGDNTIHWTNWTGHSSYGWNDDSIDVVGNPNVSGGVAAISTTGFLQSITFNYSVSPVNDWSMLAPGSLFINVLNGDGDLTWDYVVNTIGTPKKDPNATSLAAGPYGLYHIAVSAMKGINNAAYVTSGQDLTGQWSGYVIRDNHPIGVQSSLLTDKVGDVAYSGFPNKTAQSNGVSTYDFTTYLGDGLDLQGKDFIIGWEMTCANDVIYETIELVPPPTRIPPNPVPEPSTVILLGAGLAGIGLLRRRSGK